MQRQDEIWSNAWIDENGDLRLEQSPIIERPDPNRRLWLGITFTHVIGPDSVRRNIETGEPE